MPDFVHLHSHTQYSLLDGASDIEALMQKAANDQMKAVAITDHGNMFGVFKFYQLAKKHGIKPIIGCEFYVTEDRARKKFTKDDRDEPYHQLILAKNEVGYRNISKLCSLGFIEGLYGKFPRIDMELVRKYSEGLIATTCCPQGMVPRTFFEQGADAAEKLFLEWQGIFGEDYYIELQRHGMKTVNQDALNSFLVKLSRKHNAKLIATNDSHYVDQDDAEPHDILLCINTASLITDPGRFRFENDQFYFKTKAEMYENFRDLPEALENTVEVAEKIVSPELKRDVLLPNFHRPPEFASDDDYLRHLTYAGSKTRYGEVSSTLSERLEFELKVILDLGFAGYFLVVQDVISAARSMGVAVGPGRGSAAGSAVAYCTGITNLDPIHYNLLFERFLNPERITMPDIDFDVDDEGRQHLIQWVIDKYGRNQVAQIITFNSMAPRSAIRDVGRVLKYPLPETDKLAKMIPEAPEMTFKRAYLENPDLNKVRQSQTEASRVLKLAEKLEGSIRSRGIHAAGVIISPQDLTEQIPVCTAKDTDLWITQFEGTLMEEAGMLKMDFLGLKTLSIIRDAVNYIRKLHNVTIDPDRIPLDDEKTFELYQKGETIGTFQFESRGMRNYLKELKPTDIEDLIAMNALYRPGPMDFIPEFIDRKHGRKEVNYPHEWLEDLLRPTYGIMVYQEQIMQCAQTIAGYSLAEADTLRRIMGKKKRQEMEKQKSIFIMGAGRKKVMKPKAEEIFAMMERFASYGFNRSHSAAYSLLAFQTGYLKAHYPAEYMASVLTHNMDNLKQVTFFIAECQHMGIEVLGPDVNESEQKFTVTKGRIRFGLSAVKGLGDAAVVGIVEEREANGPFRSIYDFTSRVNQRTVNKRSIESLVKAGAFDSFGAKRSQYFQLIGGEQVSVIERAIRYGSQMQAQKQMAQATLFGDSAMGAVEEPIIPDYPAWSKIELLRYEKEVTGIYISGHPLQEYEMEMKYFCNTDTTDIERLRDKEVKIAGIITNIVERVDRKGNKYARFNLEDFNGSTPVSLFSTDFLKWRHLIGEERAVYIRGKYQVRFNSEEQYEIRVSHMDLLSEIRHKLTKTVEIDIPLLDVTETLADELTGLCERFPGNSWVRFNLVDRAEKMRVPMISRALKVEPSNEFVAGLESAGELDVKLVA